MLDTSAQIQPGRTLGGIAIGTPVADVLETAEPLRVVEIPGDDEDPDGVTIHSFGAIRTWSVRGEILQVGAFEGYEGTTAEGIGVGSTVADVITAYGDVISLGAPGMLVAPAMPGIGIESTEWSTADTPDPAATILQIFVHTIDG